MYDLNFILIAVIDFHSFALTEYTLLQLGMFGREMYRQKFNRLSYLGGRIPHHKSNLPHKSTKVLQSELKEARQWPNG